MLVTEVGGGGRCEVEGGGGGGERSSSRILIVVKNVVGHTIQYGWVAGWRWALLVVLWVELWAGQRLHGCI